MEALTEQSHQLPKLLVIPPAIVLATVIVAWAAIILFRLRHDRGLTMPGFSPSWWFPLGDEWRLHSVGSLRQLGVGEGIFNLLNAVTYMKNPDHGLFRGFVGVVPGVIVYKADGIEKILSSNKLLYKSFVYTRLQTWLGTGLLTSHGDKWRMRRKLLTPAFHFRILEDFLGVFDEHARVFTRLLSEHEGLKSIDIVPHVTMATLDIICETAMGVKANAQEDSGSEYVKALYVIGAGLMSRLAKPWLWFDILHNLSAEGRFYNKNLRIVKNFTMQVIEERKAEMLAKRKGVGTSSASVKIDETDEIGVKKRIPFLDLLLKTHIENAHLLPLEGVQEEVDTFMFEGHDTTAMGISWSLFLIASDPDAQAKVHQELDEIFADNPERSITHEDLHQMKYTDCCIKEAQRLYPSVPFITRSITEDIEISGHRVKANTIAALHIYRLHRDPKVFPDPERFIPERFLPENCVNRHPFAYVPFSAGPRNCIGQKFAQMELKVMVASTLRRFKLRPAVHRDEIHEIGELVLRSKDGLPLYIMPRNVDD